MVVHSKIEVVTKDGEEICSYQTKSFTEESKVKDIQTFLSKKSEIGTVSFGIKIFDQYGGFVTLDDNYLEEYNPFDARNINTTTAPPITSSDRTVTLKITLSNRNRHAPGDVQNMKMSDDDSRTVVNRNEQQQAIDHVLSIQRPPEHPTIRLSNDPNMGFIEDLNVAEEQRDQYRSDLISVRTGKKRGPGIMIQAPKKPENKQNSIPPRFIIRLDDIKNRMDHVWTLLVFIVVDVYRGGIRSLFKHPGRLQLKVLAIRGAKLHPDAAKDIICDLEDTDENELSNVSTDSAKSRLALVLRKNNEILWETLVLSNAMIFKKKKKKADAQNTSNILINATAASKRKGSTEIENTSTKQVTQSKTNKKKNNSSTVNFSTHTNDCSVPFKQNLPTFEGNINYSMNYTSRAMSSMSTNNSQSLTVLPHFETFLEGFVGENHIFRNGHNLNTIPSTIDELLNRPFDGTTF
ncbi:unnamed protein product [Adineta steineri]|uniref:Uncharacterized protein n=1 Tax=Adineta steineri TaxID=433720 RepID=A0A814QNK7_9BILA|nr:unnamed protein product [Adineta steineri]CAF1122731.1 unnamed protein product [Adineta steineri]CAF3552735.1 unnamed protein product [Adineta steineri]CAF4053080.1 unnamed protein product [Adineta steineri]